MKKRFFAFLLLLLSLAMVGRAKAACIPGEVQWQHAATNLARCGWPSLTGRNTYYSTWDDIETHVWLPATGNYASNYARYTHVYTSTTMPYGDCFDACVHSLSTFFDSTTPSFYDWNSNPRWTFSPWENGFTNISAPDLENYSTIENVWDFGEIGNAGAFWGTERYKEEWRYTNVVSTIESFAADAISFIADRWSNGLPTFGAVAHLKTGNCSGDDTPNYKKQMRASLLRYRIGFKSQSEVDYKVEWTIRHTSTQRTNTLPGLSRSVRGNGTTNYTDWVEMPHPALEEQYTAEVFGITVTPIDPSQPGNNSNSACSGCFGANGNQPGAAKDHLSGN